MKRLLSLLVSLVLIFSLFLYAQAAGMNPGSYSTTVAGMQGPMSVEVIVTESAISAINVVDHSETPGVTDPVFEKLLVEIIENQSVAVDVITGASFSSRALLSAVSDCLEQAGADLQKFTVAVEKESAGNLALTADVIIVGGGGAGLSAAVGASDEGASVILIEKTGFLGGNSIVAGGIYNCPDPDLQDNAEISGDLDSLIVDALAEKPVSEEHAALQAIVAEEFEAYKATDKTVYDSPNWFALQTWNGGDKVGTLSMIKVLTENAYPALEWLESMGMEFADYVRLGGGSLYLRTHYALTPNGTGYISAFKNTLEKRDNVEILMDTTGVSLILDGDKVVGVNATGKDGNQVTLHANNGVILATGGFAGNVELRQKFCEGEKWPDLGASVPTSNMPGVTGDGIFMAETAGAELVNMEQIQLLPFCNPQTGATYDITRANFFVNREGKRFVREDGRRDEMSKGIIDQTDSMMFSLFSTDDPSTELSLGKKSVQFYLDNKLYGYMISETIEGLAEKMGVPVEALVQTIADYNAHVESGEVDEFGRVTFGNKVEGKYYVAYPRKPAVHHTMGGVRIDEKTHAIRPDGSIVSGLYCAGEITGVIHGANRLGGNAIVDFTVFGRIAGTSAAKGE